MWAHTRETQDKITPDMALAFLKEGNRRFLANLNLNRNLLKQVNQTAEGQFPFATILSCIDSRTSAELIFDQGLGDIFSIRIAGNILNGDILGSLEYACRIAHSKLVVVLGHTRCGAIISACNELELGHFTMLAGKLRPAIEAERETRTGRNGTNLDFVNRVSVCNIRMTVKQLRTRSVILRTMEQRREIRIIGGLYSIENGAVRFLEEPEPEAS